MKELNRRDFLKAAALGAGATAFERTFKNIEVAHAEDPLFPEGFITPEFVKNGENIYRLVEATSNFPTWKLKAEDDKKYKLEPASPEIKHQLSRQKIKNIDLYEDNAFLMELEFDKGVYFGQAFKKDPTPLPAFMLVYTKDALSEDPQDAEIAVAASSGYSVPNGSDFNKELSTVRVYFRLKASQLANTYFTFFFNKDFTNDMEKSPELLGVRFEFEIPSDSDKSKNNAGYTVGFRSNEENTSLHSSRSTETLFTSAKNGPRDATFINFSRRPSSA